MHDPVALVRMEEELVVPQVVSLLHCAVGQLAAAAQVTDLKYNQNMDEIKT